MNQFFNIASHLNGLLCNSEKPAYKVFEGESFFDHELFTDEIFGACSYLLKGKVPDDVDRRLRALSAGTPMLQTLEQMATPKWSVWGRRACFEIMLHAWVTKRLRDQSQIELIPDQTSAFALTEVGLVSFLMEDFSLQKFPPIAADVEAALIECRDVTNRGLAGDLIPELFENARATFVRLQPVFDTLWSDDPSVVALRGYLAGIGFCLGWLEMREAVSG